MASDPEVYDYLANVQISAMTLSQLDSATKSTFANRSNIEFWKGPITLSRVLEVSRTYPHGLPVPELSAIASNAIDTMTTADIRPTGTEVWRVQSVSTDNDITISLNDGTSTSALQTGSAALVPSNLFLTNSLYLTLANGGMSTAQTEVAYHKVGL